MAERLNIGSREEVEDQSEKVAYINRLATDPKSHQNSYIVLTILISFASS